MWIQNKGIDKLLFVQEKEITILPLLTVINICAYKFLRNCADHSNAKITHTN